MNETINKLIEELNDAQKLAVKNPLNSCTKIVAGAGTGKTKIISKRFTKLTYDLIEQQTDTPTSRILVITFTDKAANEMKERIIKELNENGLNAFGDELWISTFHGFCSKILRKHAIEANLSTDFQLAEENDLQKIYEEIIKTLKYDEYKCISNIENICSELSLSPELLTISNLKKLSAISSLDNLFSDIYNTIKKIKSLGLTPKEFLQKTLNATEKFTQNISTLPFYSTTVEDYVINWENHLKPYIDDFCVFEKETTFKGLTTKPLILAKNNQRKAEKWTRAEGLDKTLDEFQKTENYLTKVIALIYAIYQENLEEKNIVDFDDLINKTIQILKNNEIIRLYYQKYFKHLIIDEFQDTNGSQLELIKLLLNNDEPNITFVGDRKQSIYGFRYAQMENLEVLHKYIEEKYKQKYPEIKLETNYRSTSHVLNAVNYITEEHLQLNESLDACEQKTLNEPNRLVKNSEIMDTKYSFEQKEIEAKYIAYEIQKLVDNEKAKYQEIAILVKSHAQSELIEKILTKYGIPSIKKTNKSFFNHTVIKNSKAALQLIKNPFNEIALTRILKIKLSDKELYEIKKSIDNLYVENNNDSGEKYANFCEKILKLIEKNIEIPTPITTIFNALNQTIKNKKNASLLQLFTSFAQQIPLYKAKTQTEDFQSNLNLRIFEKIISDYEQSKTFSTISNFLEYLEKIEENRNFELPTVLSTNIDAVQIMTIHASKGLEFPYTFVCAISNSSRKNDGHIILDLQYGKKAGFGLIITKLNEKASPKNLVYKEIWQKPRDLNEAIRLFYVAVSRAEKYLNIITLNEKSTTKPAFYTKDFPQFVLKEEIISTEIQPKTTPIKIEQQELPSNIQPLTKFEICAPKNAKYNFSFSKLNTYKQCPQKFLLKYKYGYPSLLTQSEGTKIGSIVHKLIYNTLVYNTNFDANNLDNILKEFQVEENAKNDILTCYNNFKISPYSAQNLSNKEYCAEHNFIFNYKIKNKEVEFIGDIDLLIKNDDNTYSIIDFKTNANIEKSKENYYAQLYLYKKAIEFQGLKVKSAQILSLNHNGYFNSIFLENEEEVKDLFDKNLELAIECLETQNSIQKDINNKNCQTCEYNYICS